MTQKPHKSLIKTNPYLRDPDKRARQLLNAVITSSMIEGVGTSAEELKMLSKIAKKPLKK